MAHGNKFPANFNIYKSRKEGNGVALSMSPAFQRESIYMKVAPQIGTDRKFDWKNAIVVKLGDNDIGELMATLRGRQGKADLFHRTDNGDTVLKIDPSTGEKGGFWLQVSKKGKNDKEARVLKMSVSIGEAVRFDEALSLGYQSILGWAVDAQNNEAVTAPSNNEGGREESEGF